MSSDTEYTEPIRTPLSPTKAGRDAGFSETTNKNVEWISSPGAWAFYVGLVFLGWLVGSVCVARLVMQPGNSSG